MLVRIHLWCEKIGGKRGVGKRTVIWAYRPHITLPPAVTIPSSLMGKGLDGGIHYAVGMGMGMGKMAYLTLHSIMVPLLRTPSWVYMGFCGFCVLG